MGKKRKGGILGRQSAAQSHLAQSLQVKTKAGKRERSQHDASAHQDAKTCRSRSSGVLGKNTPERQAAVHGARETKRKSVLSSPLQQQCAVIVSKIMHGVTQRRSSGSVKTLCLAPDVQNKRAVYAVVCETLKHQALLQRIIDNSGVLQEYPEVTPAAALVLLYDHLVGQGVKPRGPIERNFLGFALVFDRLQQELLLEQPGATKLSDLITDKAVEPQHRTARVNLLLTNVKDVKAQLSQPCSSWASEFQKPTPAEAIVFDKHLEDVLSVPTQVLAHNHPLVENGHVVLQGKASCMTARALNPSKGWKVLDACAAPGNKTTHLAALVGSKGSVVAYEKDQRRFETLKQTLDFLSTNPADHQDVDAVLLDPSCSGSGTAATRLDHLLPGQDASGFGAPAPHACPAHEGTGRSRSAFSGPARVGAEGGAPAAPQHQAAAKRRVPAADQKRVEGLVAFQTRALQHALSFPAAVRVAYSTCSVYVEENESVVAAVLPAAEAAGFSLVHALPLWHRRGAVERYPWAHKVVRVDPVLDGMDGFFVAVFERQ